MQIDQGLFKLDISDHHAVLGIPIDSDAKLVRKRYLKIARKLHPDSLRSASDKQKQQAGELLSKLVNPAYETLSHEKTAQEHTILLRLKGQQLEQQPTLLPVEGDTAKKLTGSNNIDHDYTNAFKGLAADQYESLDSVLSVIGALSELNAVYVMKKGGGSAPAATAKKTVQGGRSGGSTEASGGQTQKQATEQPNPSHPRRRREMVIDSYLKRAKEFEYKRVFDKAVTEMREAVKAYPDSALCHSSLARAYMKAGQTKMASIHCKRALELDPEDEVGNELKKQFDAQAKRANRAAQRQKDNPKEGGGGLFGGLFGGKKRK